MPMKRVDDRNAAISFAAGELAQLTALASGGEFQVSQQGTHALSAPLFLVALS
jgi:hypothetical protein